MALGNEHHFKQPLGLFDGSHGPMATCCRTPPNWPVAAELDGTVYLFQVIYPNTNDELVRKLIRCGYPIISISGFFTANTSLQQLSRRQRWMGTTPDRCPCLVPAGPARLKVRIYDRATCLEHVFAIHNSICVCVFVLRFGVKQCAGKYSLETNGQFQGLHPKVS